MKGYIFFNWVFIILFISIGLGNLIFVHLVPALFYFFLSLLYLPKTNFIVKNRLGFSIPFCVKTILFLLVMWATLGVSDLMELFEGRFLK